MILNTRKLINPGHKEEIQNKNEKKNLTKMDEKMRIITRKLPTWSTDSANYDLFKNNIINLKIAT